MTQPEDPYMNYGNSPSSPVALESVRITLELYRSGKSGIQYPKLQQFIQPILAHYQIELDAGFSDDVTPANIDDMTLLLDIFETASILWDYCCLAPDAKENNFKQLQESLLGPHPERDDLVQFPVLVASMEEQWEALAEGTQRQAVTPSKSLHADAGAGAAPAATNGVAHYGPDQLDIPEAFALFSRPLLENDAIFEDPESLDDVMSKAQAYWDLAHLSEKEQSSVMHAVLDKFISAAHRKDDLHKEALAMIKRFHELFPERG
ncbi:MAG: hypothetical protein AAF564_03390 [Bacteroidota bacterium]